VRGVGGRRRLFRSNFSSVGVCQIISFFIGV
jgi:hypothetical protein